VTTAMSAKTATPPINANVGIPDFSKLRLQEA
jgi:hypothetical protein